MAPYSKTWSHMLGRLVSSSRNEFSAERASSIARRFVASSSSSHHSTTFSTSTSSSSPQNNQLVGFIGLGAMGSRIAVNLSRAFPLIACDSSQAAVDAFMAAAAADADDDATAEKTPPRHALASALSVPELFEKAAKLREESARLPPPPLAAVLTSLPSPAAVRGVWLGEQGLIRRAGAAAASAAAIAAAAASRRTSKGASEQGSEKKDSGAVFSLVELSTIEPQTALELSAAVEKENKRYSSSALSSSSSSPPPPPPLLLRFLSAPVSGGTAAAERGKLTVIAGGPDASLRAAGPFLSPFSSRVIHAGADPGDGDAAKLANNIALAVQMASVAEALSLAALLAPRSLTPAKMLGVLNECSGRCWSSEAYPPLPELRDEYRGGFAASLMLKDLNLAKEAARKKKSTFSSDSAPSSDDAPSPTPTPMGDAAAVAYRSCPGSEDFSSVFRHFYGEGRGRKAVK